MLKIIIENFPEKFADIDTEKLLEEIQDIIDFRNALAHGLMTFNHETKLASIFYFYKKNKEIKAFALSDEKITEYNKKFSHLTFFLWLNM